MKMTKLEELMFSTIRIEVTLKDSREEVTGTGFFYRYSCNNTHIDMIITNRHVIKDANIGSLFFHHTTSTISSTKIESEEIEDFETKWVFHPNRQIDLCALNIEYLRKKDDLLYYPLKHDDILNAEDINEISAMEDIVMPGYPEGLWGEENNFPIIRKGVTATHPCVDYNGQPFIIVDIATFSGSSGSPVCICHEHNYTTKQGKANGGGRFVLLGVLSKKYTIENGEFSFEDISVKDSKEDRDTVLHLGKIIKSREITDLAKLVCGSIVHR